MRASPPVESRRRLSALLRWALVAFVRAWRARAAVTGGRLFRSVGRDGAVGHSLDPSQVPRIFKAMARRAESQQHGCKRDSGLFQAPMERRGRLFWRWILVESSVATRWSGMGSAVVRGFGRARAGGCLAAAQAASSRAVVGPKPGPGRRGGRLDILAALLRGARAAAFALAALALGVPGEAEAQDVLFVSNLNQGEDSNIRRRS